MSVDVKKLKVNELKEELRRRGLDTRGLKKAALVERLKAALGNKLSNDFPSDDEEEDDGAGGILETNGFSHMRFVEMMVEVKKEQEEAEEISAKAQECLPEQWEVKKEEVEEPQSGNGSDQQPGNDQPSEQVKAEADRSGQHSRKRPHDEGGGYGYYEHRNDKRQFVMGRPPQVVVLEKKQRGLPRGQKGQHKPLADKKGRCKMAGCKGIVRSRCSKCAVFLCSTRERNCFFDFHKG